MPTSFWVVVSANRVTCLADLSRDISPPWEPLSCERQLGRCLGYEREPRPPSGMRRLICKRICDCECRLEVLEMLLAFQINFDIRTGAEIGCHPGAVEIWAFLIAGGWNERLCALLALFFTGCTRSVLVCGWLCGVFELCRHCSMFVNVFEWFNVTYTSYFCCSGLYLVCFWAGHWLLKMILWLAGNQTCTCLGFQWECICSLLYSDYYWTSQIGMRMWDCWYKNKLFLHIIILL